MGKTNKKTHQLSRRDVLKLAGATGAAGVFGKAYGWCTDVTPVSSDYVADTGCPTDADVFPTSPFIRTPFVDPLPVPLALRSGYRNPDGTVATAQTWNVRQLNGVFGNFTSPPGPGPGQQDSIGDRPMFNDGKTYTFFNPKNGVTTTKTLNFGGARAGTHQLYPGGQGVSYPRLSGTAKSVFDALNPTPVLYHVRVQASQHTFTTSDVEPIDASGNVVPLPASAPAVPGSRAGTYKLRPSPIYAYNGAFPGPRINAEYGQPVIVRFENDLDLNPLCVSRQDFGSPDWAFLAHLENGHTAPESDGQPNHLQDNSGGYQPAQWCDNLYLGYPAGGLDAEKQSFLWFHDLRMRHAAANVYKGMVGLMPMYDPATAFNPSGIDGGDESTGLRLPGVRVDNPDGTFDVKYDIPLVLSDCRLDDGRTPHTDAHQPLTPQPWASSVCDQPHPEWWGQLFYQHYPNHGFVGDVMTVNGVAFPVLAVERRRYRFRLLDASISRQYSLSLRQGSLVPARGRQGQWTLGDAKRGTMGLGTQCMKMTQIAGDGGLLPNPVLRDALELAPSKRREVVVDFTTYLNGKKTKKGDVIYLTNTAEMLDGREISSRDQFAVPLVAFVISASELAPDQSDPGLTPVEQQAGGGGFNANKVLRSRITPPFIGLTDPSIVNMDFTFQRGGGDGEADWLVNGLRFDPLNPLWAPTLEDFELWGVNNGGTAGWTAPMSLHGEEHQVVYRSTGVGLTSVPPHPEDPLGKEDVVVLEPGEHAKVYRAFRTFLGNYVARSTNLVHCDHDAMFGWAVTL